MFRSYEQNNNIVIKFYKLIFEFPDILYVFEQAQDCAKSNDLLKTKMKIIDPKICQRVFSDNKSRWPFDEKVHICAIGEKGQGICKVNRK